jgi:thioredoxin-related protein
MLKGIQKTITGLLKDFKKRHIIVRVITVLFIFYIGRYTYKGLMWGNWNYKNYLIEGFFGKKSLEKGTKLIFFHMDGCPHCETMKPEWDKLKTLNSSSIKLEDYERKQKADLVEKFSIRGFPAIILVDDNNDKIDEYNGARKSGALNTYINGIKK